MSYPILVPAFVWVVVLTCIMLFFQVLQSLMDVMCPTGGPRAGLLRLRFGPGWLRDLWSTIFIFVFVVPYLLLILTMGLGFCLASVEGWSVSDGFHYHLFMLTLTQVNLGDATGPESILGDLFNMVTTLIGSISMLVILGMAGFTTATKRFAEMAPDGPLGLLRTIFLIYPLVILVLAAVIACAMCAIEGWPPQDSFLMACGWFSNAPLKLASCQSSNQRTTFMILLCRMVAIAMKLTALQQIFANTFPRTVACFFDKVLGNEHDWESKSVAKSDRQELSNLQERREKLEVENSTLRVEQRRLRHLLQDLGDPEEVFSVIPPAEDPQMPPAGAGLEPSFTKGLPISRRRLSRPPPPKAAVWFDRLGIAPRFARTKTVLVQKPVSSARVVPGLVQPAWAAPRGPAPGS